MVLISLTSDNFESQKMTVDAYQEVALTMSTGDHGCHDAQVLVMPDSYDRSGNYFDYAPIHWGEPVIMEGK